MNEKYNTEKQEHGFDLKSILNLFLRNWYIFGGALLFFLLVSYLYNKFAAPQYEVTSSLLFKKYNSKSMDRSEFLGGFQLFSDQYDFQNELLVLQSTPLIKEVIRNNNFYINYYEKYDFIPEEIYFVISEIYKQSPFTVVIEDDHAQPVNINFYVKLIDDKTFYLSVDEEFVDVYNFSEERMLYEIPGLKISSNFNFGDSIRGDHYSFQIFLNSNFNRKVFEGKDLYFSFTDISTLAANYQASLMIEPQLTEATIADIKFTGPNVSKSVDFVNALTHQYRETNLEKKNHLAYSTIEYIDRQLTDISDSLVTTEQQLQEFRRNYQVMDIGEKSNRIYDQLQTLENEKEELLKKSRYYRSLDEYFAMNKNSSDLIAPSVMGIEDQTLDNLIQELTTLNAEKNSLINANQERNPRYRAVNIQIDNIKETITENIKYFIRTSQLQLDDLNERIQKLEYEINRLPQTQRQLLGIERRFNLNDAVYTFLLEKRAEAQIARASNLPDCEIIEPARFSGMVFPKRSRNYILAFMAGIFLPILGFQLRDILNNRVSNRSELERQVSIPIIGKILHTKSDCPNVLIDCSKEPITDNFRALRTNLEFNTSKSKSNVILVTSSMGQEGKSFISLNLATSFALNNRTTILIGFDLRKPSRLFREYANQAFLGMSNLLSGDVKIDDVTIKTEIDNLYIIPSGESPPNPLEMISSRETEKFFETIADRYDYVIVDCPPLGIVPDALILMKYSKINLYVVRENFTEKKIMFETLKDVRQMDADQFYLVYNDERLPRKEMKNRYYY